MRVGLFPALPFHGPILAQVRDALEGRAETLLSGDRRVLTAFRPNVLVMAASAHLEYFRHHLPEAFIVNVRHGMIGKTGVRRLPRRVSARRFDAVCVGDEFRKAHYERQGARPGVFWDTGYPQLDPLFRRARPPVLSLDPARPTVLYAPTWNLGLTSAVMIGDRLVELLRAEAPDINIIIKPHPVIGDWRSAWMARWARMATTHRGVHLVADTHADVTPYLLASDVLVSDASSVIFEFLALDRPIVLVTNPLHTADPAWLSDDIVWQWRDLGHEIHDPGELPAAVALALRDPAARRERRQAYANLLFGRFTDGRNAERVAVKILEVGPKLMRHSRTRVPPPPRLRWLWHDLRTRLREHVVIRRLLFGPLESVRLNLRARRLTRAPAGKLSESKR
jgi:CDP-glycerol glycerophosphotransferase (TagB/SpsB family)